MKTIRPQNRVDRARRFPLPGLILLLLFSFPLLGRAQEEAALKFSLKDAREYAVEHSFEARMAGFDLESARQKVRETISSGFPQISSNVTYNNNMILATMLIPNFFDGKPEEKIPVQFGTQHNASANIQVQQLIFNGSYLVGLQTSRIYTSLAERGQFRSELDVLEAVTSTYFNILVAEESERILRSNLANIEKTQTEIRELNREGFVAETDVDLIQITVNQLRNALQTVGRQKEIAFKLLKFQMGLELDEDIILTETLEDIFSRTNIDETLQTEFDLNRSVDFELAGIQESLAEKALKNEKANYWPSVAAFFTYQQSAYRDAFNFFSRQEKWFPTSILGLSINLPIFKSGLQKARIRQAEVALDQARTATEQAAIGLKLEAEQAKIRLVSAHENYDIMKDNMELAEKVYGVTLEKYREGIASSMELTQASDKALQAQSDYIQALSELLNAMNSLERINNDYPTFSDKGQRP